MLWNINQSSFSTCEYPVVLPLFIKKTIFSDTELPWHPCWNQLTTNVKVHWWILNSIALAYTPILIPVPQCLDCCNLSFYIPISKVWGYQFFHIFVTFSLMLISIFLLLIIHWPFVHHLHRNIYSNLLPLFHSDHLTFFTVEL